MELKIQKLEDEGIITKVTNSPWATPIVPVLKSCGRVRICGDYKTTINPNLIPESYTLPRIDDIFANLGRGEKFTKIDLTQAYLQCELDEESKKLTTINTHLGLFVYNRLVFGITSSPAIFQRIMDTVLAGLNNVQCNQDDIVITGETNEAHLCNINAVLDILNKFLLIENIQNFNFLKMK